MTTPTASTSPKTSPWAPLRSPIYRALFFAQLGSNIGVWMQSVGAQWFLVEQTHSPELVAWVQTASLVPVVFLSLIAGVIADSFDRRTLLITTTAVSTVAAGVLTGLAVTGTLRPWSLLLVTFIIGCSSAMTSPAWQAIQPELVPREQLTAASSLGSVTVNGARAVGPAIAGLLIALSGPALVFALNALSFVGVIVALAAWKRPPQQHKLGREPFFDSLAAGTRYVRSAPIIRRILLRCALFAFPASALWALLPYVAYSRLNLGASGYGILLASLGVGSVIGVVVMPWLRDHLSGGAILALSGAAFGLGLLAVAIWPFAVVLVLSLPTGIAWIATLTTLNAGMQLSVAQWVRSRALAFYLLVFMGTQALGSFVWGALSDRVGVSVALLIAAGLLGLTAISVAFLPLRPQTSTLDRSVVELCDPAPRLVFEPEPTDGPVVITISYRVPAANATQFLTAMRAVQLSRKRTGAYLWALLLSGSDREQFREEFHVRSWGEFLRQASERWTASDEVSYQIATELADGTPEMATLFLAS
jgi:MFS family permease